MDGRTDSPAPDRAPASPDGAGQAPARQSKALFFKFAASSVSGTVVDFALFALLVTLLRGENNWYIPAATTAARVVSCVWSYLLNHKLVFKSEKKMLTTTVRYFLLSVAQLAVSAADVTLLYNAFGGSEVLWKAGVDSLLFFLSYGIQKKYVF